ncbi:MAG: glycosyltransferase family 2 protein [Bacteroidota bacterium]
MFLENKISVVIPCYNVKDTVTDAVSSAYASKDVFVEVICVDNNSNDGTFDLLQSLKSKFNDLIILKEEKPGANCARNRGLKQAVFTWIQFLDADDILDPYKLANQIEIAKKAKPEVSFIAGAYLKRDLKGLDKKVEVNENGLISVFIGNAGITSSNLWRKSSLDSVGGWNENYLSSQETELMFRLIANGFTYLYDKNHLTIVRERELGQISKSNPKTRLRQYILVRLGIIDFIQKKSLIFESSSLDKLYDFLVVTLIELSLYDLIDSASIFNAHVNDKWKVANNFGMNWFKKFLIKTLGFKNFCIVYNFFTVSTKIRIIAP